MEIPLSPRIRCVAYCFKSTVCKPRFSRTKENEYANVTRAIKKVQSGLEWRYAMYLIRDLITKLVILDASVIGSSECVRVSDCTDSFIYLLATYGRFLSTLRSPTNRPYRVRRVSLLACHNCTIVLGAVRCAKDVGVN